MATEPERIATLESQMVNVVQATSANTQSIAELNRLITARPSWAVTFVLSFLVGLCGVLGTALLTVR